MNTAFGIFQKNMLLWIKPMTFTLMKEDLSQTEIQKFKNKYKNRTFLFCWVLKHDDELNLSTIMEIELYKLAGGVFFEDKQSDKVKRRQDIRTELKEYYFEAGNEDINSILLSYLSTYEGPRKLLNDKTNPDVGIMVHQDVYKNEDLKIMIVDKKLFNGTYDLMKKNSVSFVNIFE